MLRWGQRPIEVANLLNPAFCAVIIQTAVYGYQKENSEGMPYPLVHLVLPIVLHQETRNLLPKTISTKMHVWINNNDSVKVQFSNRAQRLVPITKESVLFGLQHNVFQISDKGNLILSDVPTKLPWSKDMETAVIANKSQFVGRWFAIAGDVTTIFHMWGVRP